MSETKGRRQWVAIEFDFADHPKVLSVGALGGWAQIRAIIYCARHGTDGFIPAPAVWQILHDDPDMDEASAEIEASMVQAGLWHPVANGYQVHDYLEHQAKAESIREKRRRAGRLGGQASAKQRAKQTQASKLDVDLDVDSKKNLALDVTSKNGSQDPEQARAADLVAKAAAAIDDIPF